MFFLVFLLVAVALGTLFCWPAIVRWAGSGPSLAALRKLEADEKAAYQEFRASFPTSQAPVKPGAETKPGL